MIVEIVFLKRKESIRKVPLLSVTMLICGTLIPAKFWYFTDNDLPQKPKLSCLFKLCTHLESCGDGTYPKLNMKFCYVCNIL